MIAAASALASNANFCTSTQTVECFDGERIEEGAARLDEGSEASAPDFAEFARQARATASKIS